MNCPFCNKIIKYDCRSLDHSFMISNEIYRPQYWLLAFGGYQIGHSAFGFYIKDIKSTIGIDISEVKIEDSVEVLNKFLRLKAFV